MCRASWAWPGTRYLPSASHSSYQSAGPTCSSAMPTVYSGVLLMGQFSRWSLLNMRSTSGRAASSRPRISPRACPAICCCSAGAAPNQPVRPGECVIAIAATISAMVSPLPIPRRRQVGGQRERARRLLGVRALVRLERGMRVAVHGGAEEQAQDLRDVVLVHAELVEPADVLVAEGGELGVGQAELPGQAVE